MLKHKLKKILKPNATDHHVFKKKKKHFRPGSTSVCSHAPKAENLLTEGASKYDSLKSVS